MPDVLTVLSQRGILMPAVMVQAAQVEGIELAVAATILMKETGGGRNIYGHDPVPTGGTYVKGGAVTRENYLAYRSWMRAGSGRRQGVGPCQCTSAEYQDRADALGGCWEPLANMRSGFRGMGALIRQYGVQQGARRYNGSGPAAEAYGRDFLSRYQVWKSHLTGALPEDDMATAAEIFAYKLRDPFVTDPRRPDAFKPAGDLIAWGATHGARALAEAAAANATSREILKLVLADNDEIDTDDFLGKLDTVVRDAIRDAVIDVDVTVHGVPE